MRGRVIKVIGNNCAVHVPEEGRVYSCLIKGRVRIQGIRSTNPVVVGDWVHFTPDPQQEVTYIESIEPRRNYIIRRATNLSKESHILAANIDLALLMVTIARPRTSYTCIDTSHFFREFFAYSSDCRFANCTHLHEPGCAVLKALEEGRIAPSRYKSYLSILQDEHSGPYRPEQ